MKKKIPKNINRGHSVVICHSFLFNRYVFVCVAGIAPYSTEGRKRKETWQKPKSNLKDGTSNILLLLPKITIMPALGIHSISCVSI